MDVRSWIESQDDDTGVAEGIQQDALVKIMGTLKFFGGKRFMNALHVHPVTDFNEQQAHLLEVIYVHLLNKRGPAVRFLHSFFSFNLTRQCSSPILISTECWISN